MGMNVNNMQKDSTTGLPTDQESTNGEAHVAQNGAVTAVSGSTNVYPLNANFAGGSGDAATEFISDATGFKGFTVDIVDDIAIAADESLMICWSTSAGAETATTSTLDLLRTALGTPDGIAYGDCVVVTAQTKNMPVILWDGTTTIKTISVATQGTADKDVIVRTVG